jgi:8-amino-7-oxononanoate synthase
MNTVQVSAFQHHLSDRLRDWRERGLERVPASFSTAQSPEAVVDGDARLLFSSSNYLGLATRPEVVAAARRALDRYGAGSGGSRLTTGTTSLHRELEEELADWLGYPRCVLTATGYQANVAALTVLADSRAEPVTIFSDADNHASIIDGIRLVRASGARLSVYPHRDATALARQLAERTTDHAVVVSDGVFSMDGSVAPVARLREICDRTGALLVIDDAHGIGTVGADGRGCTAGKGRPDVLVGTSSKALGTEGGFLCCDGVVGDLLVNQARSYVFSTSSPAPVVAATLAAVRLVRAGRAGIDDLHRNIVRLRRRLAEVGMVVAGPATAVPTPVVPVAVGDEVVATRVADGLRREGFHVPAIRYPTVPRGAAILRVTVMAGHTSAQIDALVEALERQVKDLVPGGVSGSVR